MSVRRRDEIDAILGRVHGDEERLARRNQPKHLGEHSARCAATMKSRAQTRAISFSERIMSAAVRAAWSGASLCHLANAWTIFISSGSKPTLTCCGTPAATHSQIGDTIPERFRLTLATATFSTPCDTPSCRRRGSRIFGGSDAAAHFHLPRSGTNAPQTRALATLIA